MDINEVNYDDDLSIVVCTQIRSDNTQKSCGGSGSRQLIEHLRLLLQKKTLDIPIREQVCFGRCNEGIVMRIAPGKAFFTHVNENTLPEIVKVAEDYLFQNTNIKQ